MNLNMPPDAKQKPCDARILKACNLITRHADQPLPLKQIAAAVGMSPFYFQRRFKTAVGITPKAFHDAERLRLLKVNLKAGRNVTTAIYDAGFGSSSRVYERIDTRLGMTPRQYRQGGRGLAISYAAAQTPLGWLMVGATDRGICYIQFGDSEKTLKAQLVMEYPAATLTPMPAERTPDFKVWMKALGTWLEGKTTSLDLPLDVRGTAFQMRVWRYLQTIPFGEVQSYAEVARGIGQPNAARAVAKACAHNNIALAIPCHRVIRGDGTLGGYRWGLACKRTLLDREQKIRSS